MRRLFAHFLCCRVELALEQRLLLTRLQKGQQAGRRRQDSKQTVSRKAFDQNGGGGRASMTRGERQSDIRDANTVTRDSLQTHAQRKQAYFASKLGAFNPLLFRLLEA